MSTMSMSPWDRRWWEWSFKFENADGNPVNGVVCRASFDGGLTWVAADTTAGTYRWMVAGPSYAAGFPGMPLAPDGVPIVQLTESLSPLVSAGEPYEFEVFAPGLIQIQQPSS